jgi:hypothetical protein
MASTYLSKTYSGNGNRNKGTISVWCKFSNESTSSDSTIFGAGNTGNDSDCTFLSVNGNGFGNVSTRQIIFALRIGGGTVYNAVSNNLLRDVNAWYHIVVRWDTTLGTPNCDIYLNGEEVSYSANNWSSVSQNTNTYIGSTAQPHYIGRGATNAMQNNYMDGCMSHLHYCDGYYYDASTFGSTDATTGEWKINTSPSVSYGTNGFWFFKDDNTLTDQSPNSNAFSLGGGTLTKTEDCPSNVFATLNALDNFYVGGTFSNGNTTVATDVTKYAGTYSTIGASSGKYYCEMKKISGNANARFGILSRPPIDTGANSAPGNSADSVGYYSDTGQYYINKSATSYGATYGNGDIIGVAMDLDNNKLYFSKNGTWQNSGDPTSGATGTGAINIPTATTGYYHFAMGDQHDAESGTYSINFGNGYFGTTAVSSAGTNASGIGIFEYDVPTGYTALSTKGLNE